MPTSNHVIICAGTRSDLDRQAAVLQRNGLTPFGDPWPLGELLCWTWLGAAL